jgi:RHH-type rel operon transcriptional repressor/antitoxin RelB
MSRETISFYLDSEKREALDAVASALGRDRTYILNEAIDAYLDVHRWQMDHIRQGLRQADAGEFATEAQMNATFSRRRNENPLDAASAQGFQHWLRIRGE